MISNVFTEQRFSVCKPVYFTFIKWRLNTFDNFGVGDFIVYLHLFWCLCDHKTPQPRTRLGQCINFKTEVICEFSSTVSTGSRKVMAT